MNNKNEITIKEFGEFLTKESKRRNIDTGKLMSYFVDHQEELKELLKNRNIVFPKFDKFYEHSEIENITRQLFKTQKLKNLGRSVINEELSAEEVETWESKGVQYIVKVNDLPKLEGNPKVYVSQIKNINLLIGLTQEQQYNNTIKEAKCEFMLSYYAERRGYTKQEHGKILEELRRDLLTGAYTTYKVDSIIIEGKKYTAHGIPNFYILYEPEDHKNNWIVTFNNPYSGWIQESLNGTAKQYFIKDPKAIEDRTTTERPYLFLFYMQLIKRKRENLYTTPVKIGSLFEDMKLPEDFLNRPKECYELLKECLFYFSEHYQPNPEIESFNIYNDFHKTKTFKQPLHISEAFKNYPYEDFKGLLNAIGIKDIREAYISFKRPQIKPKVKSKLDEVEKNILNQTLEWFDGKIKIPREDQESMIKMYIKKLGFVNYRELFEREANKAQANAVEFLTKVLPAYLKGGTYTKPDDQKPKTWPEYRKV